MRVNLDDAGQKFTPNFGAELPCVVADIGNLETLYINIESYLVLKNYGGHFILTNVIILDKLSYERINATKFIQNVPQTLLM